MQPGWKGMSGFRANLHTHDHPCPQLACEAHIIGRIISIQMDSRRECLTDFDCFEERALQRRSNCSFERQSVAFKYPPPPERSSFRSVLEAPYNMSRLHKSATWPTGEVLPARRHLVVLYTLPVGPSSQVQASLEEQQCNPPTRSCQILG